MKNISRWKVLLFYIKDWGICMTIKHYILGRQVPFISPKRLKKARIKLMSQKIQKLEILFHKDIIDLKSNYQMLEGEKKNDIVWQFWDRKPKPELIELCTSSVKKHINQKYIELNDENLKEWYIPTETVMSKMNRGLITKTHFSDILRVN